ncbi:hypothetical protein C8F04DRAFT_1185600 [Mycena alexandri]|uniref:Uncharacterized protein n=1 Tax=Mycena alexandri TaxID=1745969 RepID=A0AAD6SU94_9AGAR|nr:hypothetical protein C8F04DRAFT_1185600 [Mycena alexandri]
MLPGVARNSDEEALKRRGERDVTQGLAYIVLQPSEKTKFEREPNIVVGLQCPPKHVIQRSAAASTPIEHQAVGARMQHDVPYEHLQWFNFQPTGNFNMVLMNEYSRRQMFRIPYCEVLRLRRELLPIGDGTFDALTRQRVNFSTREVSHQILRGVYAESLETNDPNGSKALGPTESGKSPRMSESILTPLARPEGGVLVLGGIESSPKDSVGVYIVAKAPKCADSPVRALGPKF